MSKLTHLIAKSETSDFSKWMLNTIMSRAVPFNAPHHFKIKNIGIGSAAVLLPYRRSNLNHVKGIHACALATLCEYTVGMTLVSMISEKEYRLILKSIRIEYLYQAKMDVSTNFKINNDFIKTHIITPLSDADAVFIDFEIPVHDKAGNHICTGFTNWQIKKWNKVKSV